MDKQNKLVDRVKYQTIKKFTYDQMQNFLIDIYTIGYKSAVEQINPSIKSIDESAVERAIKELIRKEFGIGEKRYSAAGMEQKIKEALDGSFEDLDVAEISVKLDEKRREL